MKQDLQDLTPFFRPDKHFQNHRGIREEHRGPRAATVNVFDQIKHAWRKVDQHREKAEKEQPAEKFQRPGWPVESRERECIPDDLKQNHVHEKADIAKHLTLRLPQKLGTRRLLRRSEVSIDEIRLHDRTDHSEKNEWHKDRAVVHQTVAEEKPTEAGEDRRHEYEVQAEVKDRIEETAAEI